MIDFINALIEHIANFVVFTLELLPSTPFNWDMSSTLGEYWRFVNYFIPFSEMVSILGLYVVAVAGWYVIRWGLRFLRYIQ